MTDNGICFVAMLLGFAVAIIICGLCGACQENKVAYKKHDLIVDFLNHWKLNKLTCVEKNGGNAI